MNVSYHWETGNRLSQVTICPTEGCEKKCGFCWTGYQRFIPVSKEIRKVSRPIQEKKEKTPAEETFPDPLFHSFLSPPVQQERKEDIWTGDKRNRNKDQG